MKALILPPAPIVPSSVDSFPVCDPAELYRMWHPSSSPTQETYAIVPVRKPFSLAGDSESSHPLGLRDAQEILTKLRRRLTGVSNARSIVRLRLPHEPASLGEQLMAIPLKHGVEEGERESREWHSTLEVTAAMFHIVGRRLALEGDFRLAMEFYAQAMAHYSHLGEGAYMGWIEGIEGDMGRIPRQEEGKFSLGKKKGLPFFDLQDSFEAYRREFLTASGRYVFMQPEFGSQPVFKSFSYPLRRSYLPEEGVLISRRFEDYWKQMPWARRFLLSRALARIRFSGNRSAAGILDTIVWEAAKTRCSSAFALRWITKAIHALDTVLREDSEALLARLVIDHYIFTYGGVLGNSDRFALWCDDTRLPKAAAGVEVYFLPAISP